MDPVSIGTILSLLVRYGPDVAQAAHKLFTTENPTQADWDALFDKSRKSFDSYMAGPAAPVLPGG